uniref:Uncharacterized protein n=1 Tax=Tanacetum cinerariifolium TaxID=118510 RepID=A0A699K9C4_TANCI|nr:hypothetical protein [Tanacetum cinerariifolium]
MFVVKGCVAPEPPCVTITFPVTNRQIASDVMIDFIIATEQPGDKEVGINEDNMIVTLTGYFLPVQVTLTGYLQHFNYQEATSQ